MFFEDWRRDPSLESARDFGTRLGRLVNASILAYQVLRGMTLGTELRERLAHACEAGDLTAGEIPVPIPNTEVKPRWADCTARESVWESRSSPT